MIDLEKNITDQEAEACAASTFRVDNGGPSFCSYANRGHNELLVSLPKQQSGILPSYLQDHMDGPKQQAGNLQFLLANEHLPESGLPFHCSQARQMLNKSAFLDGRYPSRGQFPAADQPNIATPGFAAGGYSWLPQQHQAHNNWSGVDSSRGISPCLRDTGTSDGSLFSVWSECKKATSYPQFQNMGTDQYMGARNFVSSGMENINGYARHEIDSMSNRETATAPAVDTMAWMSFTHQNPGMSDSSRMQFSRPWNR